MPASIHPLLRGSLAQRLRLASGLLLFAFAATHFLNHALGLVSLDAMIAFDVSRTASPRWNRTGVSTICPSRASTSKYSTGPMAAVMLFGKVNWFLEVILASMADVSK